MKDSTRIIIMFLTVFVVIGVGTFFLKTLPVKTTLIITLLLWFGLYVYMAYSLQIIATKTNTENGWLAWIPVANVYLVCKIAGRPGWWLLLFLIPLVNIGVSIIIWMGIAKARNKASWLGILTIIPIANLILPGYLAFSE